MTDTEIRIGNVMPYTGPLAAFGFDRKSGGCLFRHDQRARRHQRAQGQVHFRDDRSEFSRTALEQTRDLVEQERVLLMFGSFGTPSNLATRRLPQ